MADSSEYQRPWCLCPNGHWWLGWPKVVNVCTECSLSAPGAGRRAAGSTASEENPERES